MTPRPFEWTPGAGAWAQLATGREAWLPVDLVLADPARNLSRSGLSHPDDAVRDMADLLLAHGQLAAAEVRLPAPDEVERRPRLVYGYRRLAAVVLLRSRGENTLAWPPELSGRIRCVAAPAGLTDAELEDRNLVENLGRRGVPVVDLGLAALHLTGAPEDGGRGEEPAVVAAKLGVPQAALARLLLLPRLCERARALSRLHHRDPERGITPTLALKLARRPVEEQERILDESLDASRREDRVTPKGVRAVIAPRQGRQGQPAGATGAQLLRVAARLERVAADPHEQKRWRVTTEQASLVSAAARAMSALDPEALGKLPGHLGKLLELEFTRTEER